ncbi:MAG: hypothetical protein CMO22_02895 [Thiotrichales bacterium]|nr:hypothetical protein [Thiotrichales bacterium]MAX28061.1 hypothetical protein [Thiotrichales bacterium]OUX52914.1 MAG: hypothetical protein CBE42_02610 [Methylococcaceae bacterium TMED282]
MTEFESSNLFAYYLSINITFFMSFISATSALLVAAYFSGRVIPSRLAAVVIFVYVSTSIFLIGGFQRTSKVIEDVRAELPDWHTASSEPLWVLPTITGIGTVTMIFIAIAACWYFQYARKVQILKSVD